MPWSQRTGERGGPQVIRASKAEALYVCTGVATPTRRVGVPGAQNATPAPPCRQQREELERAWWEEEADLQQDALQQQQQGGAAPSAAAAGQAWAEFMVQEGSVGEVVGVQVRGGAHEVDLATRVMRPCYWPDSRHRVLRGTWYAEKAAGEWVPLREALAEQLEEAYRQEVWAPGRGRLVPQAAAGPGAPPAARLEVSASVEKGLYALFVGPGEAWLCREASFAWLRAKLGGGAAAGETRMRLRRGYDPPPTKAALEREADPRAEEADEAAAGAPVTRLVLCIHGEWLLLPPLRLLCLLGCGLLRGSTLPCP